MAVCRIVVRSVVSCCTPHRPPHWGTNQAGAMRAVRAVTINTCVSVVRASVCVCLMPTAVWLLLLLWLLTFVAVLVSVLICGYAWP